MLQFYTREHKAKIYGKILGYITKTDGKKCYTVYHIHFSLADGTKIVELNSRNFKDGQFINDIQIFME